MSHLHFLGNINNDSWVGHIGSQMLLSFGPESISKLTAHLLRLGGMEGVLSQAIDESTLRDFGIRQVLIDGMATDEVIDLSEKAAENDHPQLVPASALSDLLLLTDEFDELQVSQLTLHKSGALTFSVYLADEFKGRPFRIDGELPLCRLTTLGEPVAQ